MSAGAWIVICSLALVAAVAHAAPAPLDDPFTASPAALLAAAAAVSAADTADAIYLRDDIEWTFDDQGRLRTRLLAVYRTSLASGVRSLARVTSAWSEWRQERPHIRARVVTPDGADHRLDPATLVERPAVTGSAELYTDRRVLEAPLPALEEGAVVVTEVIQQEKKPYFEKGRVESFLLGNTVAVMSSRVEISAPRTMSLRVVARGVAGPGPARSQRGGRQLWSLVLPAQRPWRAHERWALPESTGVPRVELSTGRSWAEVADAYRALIETPGDDPGLAAEVRRITEREGSRPARLSALVALLHRRVRYTGIELGMSGLVPAPLDDVLQRGYGDCKDKSMVLIRMLRMAGFQAHLALLQTGGSSDVDPELPGLGSFDHAIVRVAGTPPVWIDATTRYTQPGELVLGVEGRLALVIAPGTTGLVRLPEAGATDNRIEERRAYRLAERGPARVSETTTYRGQLGAGMREDYALADTAKSLPMLRDYARAEYTAKGVDSVRFTRPDDLSQPFTLGVWATQARVGETYMDGAQIPIPIGLLFERLRGDFQTGDAAGSNGGAASLLPERHEAAWIPIPHERSLRVEVQLPDGLAVPALPDDQAVELGPVHLRSRAWRESTAVMVEYVADSGPRRWTVQQYERFRTAVDSLSNENMPMLDVVVSGYESQRLGRFREALAEFRRLSDEHPREALHLEQIADVLLDAGLGEDARQVARKEIELEPRSAAAHRDLGYTLMHDLLGRAFAQGCDLPGAEVELRRAIALDSTDALSRRHLALLLQRGTDLLLRGSGSRLAAAVEQEYHLRRALGVNLLDGDLLTNLAHLGRFAEILTLLPEVKVEEPDPRALELVALAARDGVPAATRRAARVYTTAEARQAVLVQACILAMQVRRYPEARGLLAAAMDGTRQKAALEPLAAVLANLKIAGPLPSESRTPEDAIQRLFGLLQSGADDSTLRSLAVPDSGDEDSSPRATMSRMMRSNPSAGPFTSSLLVDLIRSGSIESEGDPRTGFRASLSLPVPGNQRKLRFYLVPGRTGLRFLSTGDAVGPLGTRALELVERGDRAGAVRWLRWARNDRPEPDAGEPLSKHLFDWWLKGDGEPSVHAIRASAAALAAAGGNASQVVRALEQERTQAASDDERLAIDVGLGTAFDRHRRWAELEPVARRLCAAKPGSGVATDLLFSALEGQERWDDLRALADERLRATPDDRKALRVLASVDDWSGKPRSSWDEWHRRLTASDRAEARDFNDYAWAMFVHEADTARFLETALKGATPEAEATGAALNTLAHAYVSAGRLPEAKNALLQSMDRTGHDEPTAEDWFVIGRIAEGMGEVAAARTAYARVTPEGAQPHRPNSSWSLAQARLAKLPR